MHYYPHHIGDYRASTATLSLIQHGAYRTLLDEYYLTGKPLPSDAAALYRICRAMSREEQRAVDFVAKEFFTPLSDGLRQSRVESELAEYDAQVNRNRENGRKGGRKPKPNETQNEPKNNPVGSESLTQSVSEGLSDSEPKTNPPKIQEPRAIEIKKTACAEGDWPTLEQVTAEGAKTMIPPQACEWYWNDNQGKGWMDKGQPIFDWRFTLRNFGNSWKNKSFQEKQKSANGNKPRHPAYNPATETAGKTAEEISGFCEERDRTPRQRP